MSHKKHFYIHLIEVESLQIELDTLELSDSEKMELAKLIDSNFHHTILDEVLSHLEDEDKKTFLGHLRDENHDKIWELLNEKVEEPEVKIKRVASELKKQFHADIIEAKQKKGNVKND